MLRAPPANAEVQLDDVPVEGRASDSTTPTPTRLFPVRPKKKADCNQLYYTDSTGIRRVKRDCL